MTTCDTKGLTGLFSQLCDLHCSDLKRAYLVQPRLSRDVIKRRLRKKLYDGMFKYQRGPHRWPSKSTKGKEDLNEVEQILSLVFERRCQRKFDEANLLEGLLNKLLANEGEQLPLARQVLKFLVCLRNTGGKQQEDVLGHEQKALPLVGVKEDLQSVIPDGPLLYGDTRLPHAHDVYYMQYPSDVFEKPGLKENIPVSPASELGLEIFEAQPGSNLQGNGLFNTRGLLDDNQFEKASRHTLFGALVHSRTTKIDVCLDLPDLMDSRMPEIKVPKIHDLSDDDEGFISASSSVTATPLKADREDIWEMALKCVPSEHYTWETIGNRARHPERPFLTEAGPDVFDAVYKARQRQLLMIDPTLQFPELRLIDRQQLTVDVINLLIGVPSYTFMINETSQTFHIHPGTYVSGLSPEGLETMCKDLMTCATNYWRLSRFSQPPVINSFYTQGLIFQAFTGGVRKYLQHYRACVLSIPRNKTVMEINVMFQKIKNQIRYLAELCMCGGGNGKNPGDNARFPLGVNLISYLYQEALDSASSDNHAMLLSLLNTACGPYVMFIQDWVFHGICRDIYGEFMIRVNGEYLQCRDKAYWSQGYVLTARDPQQSVPLFLNEFANDIFICGKSINLLKLCCPSYFLCNVDIPVPRITITFSEDELDTIDQRCQIYISKMELVAKHAIQTKQAMMERAERAKQELIKRAREVSAREMDRLQARIDELRKAADEKKRREFAELKSQMERDLRRRAMEVEQEKEEDKERMETVIKKEEEEREAASLLEQQAREELVEMYAKMSEEAAYREMKALWKVRRHRLDGRRLQLLQREDAYWTEQMRLKLEQEEERQKAVITDETPVPATETTNLMDLSLRTFRAPSSMAKETSESAPVMSDIPDIPTANLLDMPRVAPDASVATANLLNLSLATPGTQGTANVDGGNVMDMSINALPRWAQQGIEAEKTNAQNTQIHVSQETVEDTKKPEIHIHPDRGASTESIAEHDVLTGHVRRHADAHAGTESQPGFNILTGLPTTKSKTISGSPLPKWAEKALSPPRQESDLPGWAKQGLEISPPAFGLDTFSSENVPNWAKDKKTQSEVKVVGLDDVDFVIEEQDHDSEISTAKDDSSVRSDRQIHDTDESKKCDEKQEQIVKEVVDNVPGGQNLHVSQESEEMREKIHIKKSETMFASKESEPQATVIKKRSVFGHVSEISHGDYDIAAPRLKRQAPALDRSTTFDRCFQVKSKGKSTFKGRDNTDAKTHLKMQSGMHATKESEQKDVGEIHRQKFLAQNIHGHASKESEYVDVDQIKLEKFKQQNVRGHASDSTVQRLLYGGEMEKGEPGALEKKVDEQQITESSVETPVWLDVYLEPYKDNFEELNEPPVVDLMSNIIEDPLSMGDYSISTSEDVQAHQYVSLPVLLKRSVTAPLIAQVSLVNRCIVSYFMNDLNIEEHFEALRMFLFMEDGEFSQTLSDQLFEKLSTNPLPHHILNPVFLGNALNKALRSSLHGEDKTAKNISIAVRYTPQMFEMNKAGTLDCLELNYKVDWPLNIIITESCIMKYSKVFSYLLQLKRVVWTLKDIWHRLKRDALLHNASHSPQFRQLQLFRHEMQYFIKVMQGYVASQVIHVGWSEFQQELAENVHSLDDLYIKHAEYLNNALFRCLLNKKAAPLMKIIQDIFNVILKFRSQLVMSPWQIDPSTGQPVHRAFKDMVSTYQTFRGYSVFLFKVVNKLSMRGYQNHLVELLLRLNFNGYYRDELS